MKEIKRIKSISEVHHLYQLPKPKHPLVSVLPIDERMTNFDYGDISYVFDFFQISLKEGVSGSWAYGRNSYDFQEGTMTFIKPNQVIQVENPESFKESGGWTLLFHPDLIRKSELGQKMDDFSFFSYEANEALHLSEEEKESITEIVSKVKKEYNQNIDRHSQELIIANIEILLKYCKRYYDRQFYTRTNLNKDIITKFEQVIKNYYEKDNAFEKGVLSVKECAKTLNMSPNYLGDLIKNETGKSAKEHLQDYLIEKAKTQIIATNDSISQIAFSLGFEHPQSFNKLFKAKTGMSPTAYRKINFS